MSNTAIRVEGLSKRYRIGPREPYKALRDVLPQAFAALFGWTGRNQRTVTKAPSTPKNTDGWVWALKDVSFEVKHGEVVGIIGRNGAGKTTILKILSRITRPTEGYAEIHGRIGSLLEVGTGFHPELTGRENIYLNGAILGMKKTEIQRKFDEIVAFAEIEKFIDTPVKYYSSGMYVRLAFAVAAHLEPEILVVDEVLAVGDAAFQSKCLGKMGEMASGGRTVLFVSHNMGAVKGLCGRAIWINNGSIVADGMVKDIVNVYIDSTNENLIHHSRYAHTDFQDVIIERVFLKNDRGEVTSSFECGKDIRVEILYNAPNRIPNPYFWISIESQYGPMFGANMLLDNLRPDHIEGKGLISCVFKNIRLLPQTFTVNLGIRDQNGTRLLAPTVKTAAIFRIVGNAQDLGIAGPVANVYLERAAPMLVPYEWHFMNGLVAKPGWVSGSH